MTNYLKLGLIVVIALVTSACSTVSAAVGKPVVMITAPASDSQFHTGDPVNVQSTSIGDQRITKVELLVDGNVVRSDPAPEPQLSFTVNQTWTATTGIHTLSVRATNTTNATSDPASITVVVIPVEVTATPTAVPSATLTATPNRAACANNSTFITDVTIPDGTAVSPGQVFNKIWRVRNSGTCAWTSADSLSLIAGEAMTTTTAVTVPVTAPGVTTDLVVTMVAPTTPGVHAGTWRLKSASGTFFGAKLTTVVNVVQPSANCPFTPVIASFTASPSVISPGQSATLSWGFVTGAEKAEIDNDIGGVATPGSTTVTPAGTTTYTMTATCGSKVRQSQVTITVANPTVTPAPPTETLTLTPTPTHTPTPTP